MMSTTEAPQSPKATGQHAPLGPVVDGLCGIHDAISIVGTGNGRRRLLPSRDVLVEVFHGLRAVMFPGYFSNWDLSDESLHFYVGATLDKLTHALQGQVRRGLCLDCGEDPHTAHRCHRQAEELTHTFLQRLPAIRRTLALDVQAGYEGDPAARSPAEVIFSYPGLLAIVAYRLAHELHLLGAPLIPRIITEYAHGQTGIDIHPGARISEHFFIDHGTGVVIGETCEIGARVRIFQGVTLGAKSFPLDADGNPIKGIPRHPLVEDDVIIYSGATILGRVTIGRGAVIGGNVWVTRDVPPGSFVTQTAVRQGQFENGGGI